MSRGSRMQTMRMASGKSAAASSSVEYEVWVLQDKRARLRACGDVGDVPLGKGAKEGQKAIVRRIEEARLVAELLGPLIGGEDVGEDVRFRQIRRAKGIRQQRL